MKKLNFISVPLLLLFFLAFNLSYGSATDTTKANKGQKEQNAKNASDTSQDKPKDPKDEAAPLPVIPTITEPTLQMVSLLFFVVMLFLFYKIFLHLRNKNQYIGFQSIKLIGLILMFPGICIIALVGGGLIGSSTLAALLGSIAGYVLSTEDDAKNAILKDANSKLQNDKDALDLKIKALNTQIEQLKTQIP